jgi:Stage II sporulation protein E (SpoIIE)
MKAPSMDELVALPEAVALQKHFDAKNYRVLRGALVAIALLALAGIAVSLVDSDTLRFALSVGDLVITLALFAAQHEGFFERYFRQILVVYLFVQMVLPSLWSAQLGDSVVSAYPVLPVLLLFLRLRVAEHLVLFGTFWVVAVLRVAGLLAPAAPAVPTAGLSIGLTLLVVVCFAGALAITQLERRRFLSGWRYEHLRARERLRMREEIEYARRIQLSMLPQSAPDLAWVEVAAASLPATEVGGDYYDYFRLSPSQLAVVIGDVAGHGLASGLLLSGVRSCLYLLEDDLASPVDVLVKLNRMVRRTTARRTHVTLLCLLLDRAAECLTVATAGHPPLLHYRSGERQVEEIGHGAPPLGTRLEARYVEERRPLAAGDVLAIYTDGLIESRNDQAEEYGSDRLERAFRRAAARTSSAREVREAVLSDLANFKGDVEQADDLTLVVVRVR